jgi:hypothetical protein
MAVCGNAQVKDWNNVDLVFSTASASLWAPEPPLLVDDLLNVKPKIQAYHYSSSDRRFRQQVLEGSLLPMPKPLLLSRGAWCG